VPDRIRTLVVDDEPVARAGMRRLLEADAELEIVGEAGDGRAAAEAIRTLRPDLLLLDVQMPEMDGFEVLETVGVDSVRAVIFVTAYDRFAIRAFEVQALDYVLKPFDDERFACVIERAKRHVRRERDDDLAARLSALLARYEPAGNAAPARAPKRKVGLARIMVKDGGRVFFLPVEEIDWIEAADYYARLHAGKSTHLVRESLASLEASLDPAHFVRIHRSAIVNVDRIRELRPDWRNHSTVVLASGERLPVSRSRREALERALKG
jgi:two-component system LytT family response regulator